MPTTAKLRKHATAAVLLGSVAVAGLALRPAQRNVARPLPDVSGCVDTSSGPRVFPSSTCGTPDHAALGARDGRAHGLHAFADIRQDADGLPDGTPLWYRQIPPLLHVDQLSEGLAFDDFVVLGDQETLELKRWSSSEDDHVTETWPRVGTRDISGRTVSVFNPRWDEAALRDSVIWGTPRGFDRPLFEFGKMDASHYAERYGEGAQFGLYVAVMPLNTPESRVERIDDRAQYASHVVNLVMPEVIDSRVSSGNPDWREVTRQFYLHFPDEYDSIAINFAEMHSLWAGGFHSSIQNPISGLGREPIFDNSGLWGSSGRLRAIEGYANTQFSSIMTSLHEMAHQWVDFWNWSELAGGIARGGHQPGSHTPLLFPGEMMAGAILTSPRYRVARASATEFVLERTPAPARYHPTTLYRMGLIGPDTVPDLLVFENQNRLQGFPNAGDPVEGGTRPVSIEDIVAMHGERSGPVDDTWRRATIVVSRDGLISREEMSFWNFLAIRHEATSGVHRLGSFYQATHGMARLHTDLTPKGAPKIINDPPIEVAYPPIHPREFLDVQLDDPVPALLLSSSELTLSGVVMETQRTNYGSPMCALAWGTDEEDVFRRYEECATVGSDGRFFIRLGPLQPATYYISLTDSRGWLGIMYEALTVVGGK